MNDQTPLEAENDQWYETPCGVTYPEPAPVEAFVLVPMRSKAREAAIAAVHRLEAQESDPSVEQCVDAVLGVVYRPGLSGGVS